MVIYEVTAEVDIAYRAEFEEFMTKHHISDVLSTGYFAHATFSRAAGRYRVQYMADSILQVEEYIQVAAPALRNDFLSRFPNGVMLSRENWDVISTHDGPINK